MLRTMSEKDDPDPDQSGDTGKPDPERPIPDEFARRLAELQAVLADLDANPAEGNPSPPHPGRRRGGLLAEFLGTTDMPLSLARGNMAGVLLKHSPAQQAATLVSWKLSDPDLEGDLRAAGFDPDNVEEWAAALIAGAHRDTH